MSMNLHYENKAPVADILNGPTATLSLVKGDSAPNKLYFGNSPDVIRTLIGQGLKVDLVYIDPPYGTGSKFMIGKERTSTISSSLKDNLAYDDSLCGDQHLELMRTSFILLNEVMSENASIYVHIDVKSSHYFKLLLDEVFGVENFRNDIARIKCNPKNSRRKMYGNIRDVVLFYTKSSKYIWNDVTIPHTKDDIAASFKKIDPVTGKRYTTIPLHAPGESKSGKSSSRWRDKLPPKGRHWRTDPAILEEWDKQGLIEWSGNGTPRKKRFEQEARLKGKKVQDLWIFKDPPKPQYPTQKNLEMLEMIVKTSSNPDSVVMDCFSGSGTTLVAAENCNRRWLGIDASNEAIKVIQSRITTQFEYHEQMEWVERGLYKDREVRQ